MKQMLAALVILCATLTHNAAAQTRTVTVAAGDFDRAQTVASFPMPQPPAGGWALRGAEGSVPLQWHGGRAWFVIHGLNAGQTRAYELVPATQVADDVFVSTDAGIVHVRVGGKAVFDYQGAKVKPPAGIGAVYERGGYIHPVLTPSGVQVDDDYPMNHKHHHGIWSVWTKTEFEGRHPDFWNMGDKTGTSEPRGFKDVYSGPVAGGFHAEHQMIDVSANPPRPVINESWDVTAFSVGTGARPYFLFDIDIRHECASASPLKLPQYLYGGLGFRGAHDLNGEGKYTFLTSEGKGVVDGNGTRARWCFTGGTIEGKPAGLTIFCRPDSFRAPQPVRLNPKEPFFCYAPPAMGEFSITPDQPYQAHYRMLVADGAPDTAMFEQAWNDYANPPKVTLN